MSNHKQLLEKLDACEDGIKWYNDQDSYTAWRSCQRGDWLLWVAAKLGVARPLIVLAACDCAELLLKHVPSGELRPRAAIEAARRWCAGEADSAEVGSAARSARAAAYAAAYAAYAADAARAAAYAADGAYAAAYAAYAAYDVDADCADCAVYADGVDCAALVRKRIPWRVVKKAIATITEVDKKGMK